LRAPPALRRPQRNHEPDKKDADMITRIATATAVMLALAAATAPTADAHRYGGKHANKRHAHVTAPYTRVDRHARRVEVDAPFAYVNRSRHGVRVVAPFVDIFVPRY